MKHIKLFEEFLDEERESMKIEAAKAADGTILFKSFGKFIGKLSLKVNVNDKDEKRDEEIKELMLKTFPASEEWKTECEKHKDAEVYEEVILAAAKERSQGDHIGEIQLWDEQTLTHSIRMGGPFSDQRNSISGKYVGGFLFAHGISKDEVRKITKVFNTAFPGSGKTKQWIESN